jgi:hypothetical protein
MNPMPPQQGTDPKDASMTTRVESRVKSTTVEHAHQENGKDPYIEVTPATVQRDALYLYYLVLWAELSDDIRDDLDPDRLADAIVTVPNEYVIRVSSVDVAPTDEVEA